MSPIRGEGGPGRRAFGEERLAREIIEIARDFDHFKRKKGLSKRKHIRSSISAEIPKIFKDAIEKFGTWPQRDRALSRNDLI
jgi:hypothetical protein